MRGAGDNRDIVRLGFLGFGLVRVSVGYIFRCMSYRFLEWSGKVPLIVEEESFHRRKCIARDAPPKNARAVIRA